MMSGLLIFLLLIISIISAIFTWKISGFFLSRRDYYVNSQYELIKKKLSMSLFAAFLPFVVAFLISPRVFKKGESSVLKENFVIYQIPDKNSEIIYQGNSKIKILDSTKYFYKVNFMITNKLKTGYLLKSYYLKN